ncbi:DUF6973 domain-containing protein [Laceyella tengchongensis]|jgi:hypothetical protein
MNLNSKLTACTIALSMFFFSNVNNSFATEPTQEDIEFEKRLEEESKRDFSNPEEVELLLEQYAKAMSLGADREVGDVGTLETGWYSLTAEEERLVRAYPYEANSVRVCKEVAESLMTSRFSSGFSDGKADAFRHAMWNACMTREIGVALASDFATAHEQDPNQKATSKEMDLYNNWRGRKIATDAPNQVNTWYANTIVTQIGQGYLKYIKDGKVVYTNQ